MALVTIRLNGFPYTVGCEDGQETHLQAMAAEVDHRIESIRALGAGTGGSEPQMLALVALMLADEVHDLAEERDRLRATAAKPARPRPDAESRLKLKLDALAGRAEEIAAGLERP